MYLGCSTGQTNIIATTKEPCLMLMCVPYQKLQFTLGCLFLGYCVKCFALSYLILATSLRSMIDHTHLTDEETKIQRVSVT